METKRRLTLWYEHFSLFRNDEIGQDRSEMNARFARISSGLILHNKENFL